MCQGDVFGNQKLKYLCKECQILYSEEELKRNKKVKEQVEDKKEVKKDSLKKKKKHHENINKQDKEKINL
jgi:hypothetical protein